VYLADLAQAACVKVEDEHLVHELALAHTMAHSEQDVSVTEAKARKRERESRYSSQV
jgi:hypothetical protein